MSLRIVHYNDPILRKKGARVTVFDALLMQLSRDMVATMHAAAGIGLAAQQIGVAVQLCVIDLREVEQDFTWNLDGAKPPLDLIMPMTLANPEITVTRGTESFLYEEGCLSFPKIRGDVARPDAITVKFQDEYGLAHVLTCDGLFSRCIQHETDHLNGILFIDRMDKKVRGTIDDEVKSLAKATRDETRPPAPPSSPLSS
jgi:peptide deformylase